MNKSILIAFQGCDKIFKQTTKSHLWLNISNVSSKLSNALNDRDFLNFSHQ